MFRLVRLFYAVALFIASIIPSWALAQSIDDLWTTPLNLSHSGVAVNPAIVIDSDGIVHTVWQDDFANFVYSQFDGSQWTAPETTNLNRRFGMPIPGETPRGSQPVIYTGPNPLFIPSPGKDIFAFWISPDAKLFTSRVNNPDFKSVAAWNSGRLITPEAASFAVAVDASGEWHLAFVSTVGDPRNPAGIYYTRSQNLLTSAD
jgi:hypothetical protein